MLQRIRPAVFACCIAASGLAGCGVPTAGPTASEISQQAADQQNHFDMVEIDGRVVSALAGQHQASLSINSDFYGKPRSPTIGLGDSVSVSIWQETNSQILTPKAATADSPGGQGGPTSIPDQVVGPDGGISVPYAGRVPAAGRTPLQVQQTIEQRLSEQLARPQVIITVSKAVSNSATVFTEQATAARIHLATGSERLLDVIAAAGGSKTPFYETSIRLSRNGQTATIPMTAVLSDPRENVFVWPDDVITLIQTPSKFSVFGATSTNSQVPFGADRIDLAQAIAKAGGLLDARADPEGVYLFRFERPSVIGALGVPALANDPKGDTPVVYHLNLRQVDGYFLAARFALADNDLIYVANARMTDLQKFFTLIGTITGPVIGGVVVVKGVGN